MINITDAAAKQVKQSMETSNAEGLSLRIAAKRLADGSFDYAMGFDHFDHNDSHSRTKGVEIVVAPTSTELLKDATLDFVEMGDGEYRFIFINPNDPQHSAPADDEGEA